MKINRHVELDQMKLMISREILSEFSIDVIKTKSRENLLRWRDKGTWGQAYEEWLAIVEDPDDSKVIAVMNGEDEESNQLRQSFPYVGLRNRKNHEN